MYDNVYLTDGFSQTLKSAAWCAGTWRRGVLWGRHAYTCVFWTPRPYTRTSPRGSWSSTPNSSTTSICVMNTMVSTVPKGSGTRS